MSAETQVNRAAHVSDRLRYVAIAMLAVAAVVAGILTATTARQWTAPATIQAPAFNAVQFRADEKLPLVAPAEAWDASQFRAEEKLPPAPVFDAVQFRASEKSL